MEENLIKFFNDYPPLFGRVDSTRMKVNGKQYDYADVGAIDKIITAEVALNYDLIEFHRMAPLDKARYFREVVEKRYRPELSQRKERKAKYQSKVDKLQLKLPDIDYIFDRLVPARVIGENRKDSFRFLDSKTNEMTDYNFYAVHTALSKEYEEAEIRQYLSTAIHIRPVYDPQSVDRIRTVNEDKSPIHEINLHRRPSWWALYDDVEPKVDKDIAKLLIHLFPHERCREFVLNWIYHSMTGRCGTYLYLCGGQGSGKNTFAHLVRALHGFDNSSFPKQDTFSSRFNTYLENKTFVFFDEFLCRSRQDKNILKAVINDLAQVEAKGIDAKEIDIHASYMIANNHFEDIGLDPIDRRFSVPDISDENIINVYGREWIENLNEKFDDDRAIAAFAKYVFNEFRIPKYSSEEPYQTERFETIVWATARAGYQEILNKITNGEEYEFNYADEKAEFIRINKVAKYPALCDWKKFFTDLTIGGKPAGSVHDKTFKVRKDLRSNYVNGGVGVEDRV